MAGKVQQKREALRARLIDIAEARIVENGIDAIKARDLASEAGCALGAIYTVFDDIQHVVMAVNGRTFRRLGAEVTAAVSQSHATDPTERLVIMGRAYLAFAAANTNAWRTLFDIEMSTDHDVPDWYMAELSQVFALIYEPLRTLYPDLSDEQVALMTRALFSSVHGIVLLGLEKRISAVPIEELGTMIELLLRRFTRP